MYKFYLCKTYQCTHCFDVSVCHVRNLQNRSVKLCLQNFSVPPLPPRIVVVCAKVIHMLSKPNSSSLRVNQVDPWQPNTQDSRRPDDDLSQVGRRHNLCSSTLHSSLGSKLERKCTENRIYGFVSTLLVVIRIPQKQDLWFVSTLIVVIRKPQKLIRKLKSLENMKRI